MSTNLEKWAIHHLRSIIDYLDEASILQITKAAIELRTANEVVEYFSGLLGEDTRAVSFITEFNSRRFASRADAAVPASDSRQTHDSNGQKKTVRKNDVAVSKKPIGNTTLSSDLGRKPKTSTTTKNDPQLPKIKKVDALSEIDAALRDLELSADKSGKKLITCDCAARRHGLNTISPNCLSCGKIICSIESYSRCSFCNAELIDRRQRDEIIAELKRERGQESAGAKQQRKKATAGSGQRTAYAGKLGANYGPSNVSRMDDEDLREKTEAAEKRKNELLAHVESGYRRTVIDQASDFTAQAADKWASPAERALALRRAQAAMHADNDRGRVISLSIGSGGKVTMRNDKREKRTEEEVDAEIIKEQRKIDEERRREEEEQARINQGYTRDKLMGQLGRITFPASAGLNDDTPNARVDWWQKGQKGWRRVQEDEGDDVDERMMLGTSSAMDLPGHVEEAGVSKR